MKKLPIIITVLILASCSTSSDVVQNGRINKRKYNEGFFIKSHTNNHQNFLSNFTRKNIWHKKSKVEKSPVLYADLNANSSQIIPSSSTNEILNEINNSKRGANYPHVLSENSKKEVYEKLDNTKIKEFKKIKKLIKKEIIASYKGNKNQTIDDDDDANEGEKSQIVTLILLLFIGVLGIHRFYLGHIGIGLLYLFTGGLCGIGVIIDLILILTGGLNPKDGSEYYDKFI